MKTHKKPWTNSKGIANCNVANQTKAIVKVSYVWDKVTCKHCLKTKDTFQVSSHV